MNREIKLMCVSNKQLSIHTHLLASPRGHSTRKYRKRLIWNNQILIYSYHRPKTFTFWASAKWAIKTKELFCRFFKTYSIRLKIMRKFHPTHLFSFVVHSNYSTHSCSLIKCSLHRICYSIQEIFARMHRETLYKKFCISS